MRRASLILLALLAAPLAAAEPSKFTLQVAGGSAADPLTVLGPASVCADNQVARWNGASATAIQCSPLVVADTTGDITAPGALTISATGAAFRASGTAFEIYDSVSTNVWKIEDGGAAGAELLFTQVFDRFRIRRDGAGIGLTSVGTVSWNNANTASGGGTYDLLLLRDAAATLAQRNGTNQQTFRLYNTYTDGSNYERLSLSGTAGSSVNIKAETAGTGADDLSVNVSGSGVGTVNLTRARIVPSAAPPVTCAAGTEGSLYVDSDTHKLCYCNGSGWVLASDDSTGCS